MKISNYMSEYIGPPRRRHCSLSSSAEEARSGFVELLLAQPALGTQLPLPVNETAYLNLAEFWIEARGSDWKAPDCEETTGQQNSLCATRSMVPAVRRGVRMPRTMLPFS